jgi:WD40 repeat protein
MSHLKLATLRASVAFSPDDYRLASDATDNTVIIWDVKPVPEKP